MLISEPSLDAGIEHEVEILVAAGVETFESCEGSIAVDFSCAPLSGGDEWFSAGPWEIVQSRGPDDGLCREDFMSVGTGKRFSDRNCTRPSGTVQFMTWARREATTPAAR